jgi:hypothetical protein
MTDDYWNIVSIDLAVEPTMVIKTGLCAFSQAKIYPGHGKLYIRNPLLFSVPAEISALRAGPAACLATLMTR